MLALTIASLGDHVRMLAEQQHVFDSAGFARRHDALLQRVRFRVADEAEIDGKAGGHFWDQTLICSPRTEAKASPMPSHTVGCACIMLIISSMVPSRCRTAAASARISVASGPMMWMPSTSPYFSSETTLMKPPWLPRMVALLLPTKGNLPVFTAWPASRACFSVKPMEPICGSQ